MPLSHEARILYNEIVPKKRLAYTNLVDFVPDVKAYNVDTLLELEEKAGRVQLRLTLDPMHDSAWTHRAVSGWESELGKLGRALAAR